jgi:propanediol utilization protein
MKRSGPHSMQQSLNQTAAVKCRASQQEVLEQIPVAVTARHVHLSQETIDRLFGDSTAT